MKKRYLVLWFLYGLTLAVLTLVALLMSVENLAIAVIYMTCGLGFPIVYAATFAAYFACLAPAVALAPFRWARWLGLLITVGSIVGFATVPHDLSQAAAAAEVARVTADDLWPTAPVPVRSLQIVRPDGDPDLRGKVFDDALCDDTCRALLLGGEVAWVRVVRVPRHLSEDQVPTAPVRFERLTGAGCGAPGEPVDPNAACVLFRDDAGEPAELVLTLDEDRWRDPLLSAATMLLHPVGHRRLTATRTADGEVLLRDTEVHLDTLVQPTILGPQIGGQSSVGLELTRTTERFGALDLAAALRALGFSLHGLDALRAAPEVARDWSDPPPPELTLQVVSLLDLPGDAEFTDDQQNVIARWMDASRIWREGNGWNAERVAIVRRIVREVRASRASSLAQVLRESPAVTAAVAGDVIEMTELHGLPLHRPWSDALYGLDEADPAVLAPFAARVIALLEAHPDEARRFLPLVGRLGLDPSPYLLPLPSDGDREVLSLRVRGACHADDAWAALLVPPLRDLLAGLDLDKDDHLAELAATTLVRHGDETWVKDHLTPRGKDGERLWRGLGGRLKRTPDRLSLCP